MLLGLNEQGEVVEGTGHVDIAAMTIHLGLHKARPDAKCAGHIHSPYATALGERKRWGFSFSMP